MSQGRPRGTGTGGAILVVLTASGAMIGALLPGSCTPHARYTRPSRVAQAPSIPDARDGGGGDSAQTVEATAGSSKLENAVESYIGTPYRYGGTTRKGMDCSGLVWRVFLEVHGMKLPRTSHEIAGCGRAVSLRKAQPGDVVLFRRGALGRIDHVGIYMGGREFVHAGRSRGVMRSSLDEEYHAKRFAGLRRLR